MSLPTHRDSTLTLCCLNSVLVWMYHVDLLVATNNWRLNSWRRLTRGDCCRWRDIGQWEAWEYRCTMLSDQMRWRNLLSSWRSSWQPTNSDRRTQTYWTLLLAVICIMHYCIMSWISTGASPLYHFTYNHSMKWVKMLAPLLQTTVPVGQRYGNGVWQLAHWPHPPTAAMWLLLQFKYLVDLIDTSLNGPIQYGSNQ